MDKELRPVAFIVSGLASLSLIASVYFLAHPSSPFVLSRLHADEFYGPLYFFVFVTAFNFAVCIGVLMRRRWAYRLFVLMLYLLFFGFPIGTLIAYLTLSYMRRHRIGRYFGLPPHHDPFPSRIPFIVLGVGAVALYLWMMLAY